MVTYVIASKANQPYLAEVSPTVLFYLIIIFIVPNAGRVPREELSRRIRQDRDQASEGVA